MHVVLSLTKEHVWKIHKEKNEMNTINQTQLFASQYVFDQSSLFGNIASLCVRHVIEPFPSPPQPLALPHQHESEHLCVFLLLRLSTSS